MRARPTVSDGFRAPNREGFRILVRSRHNALALTFRHNALALTFAGVPNTQGLIRAQAAIFASAGQGSAQAGILINPSIQRTTFGNPSSGISDSRQ